MHFIYRKGEKMPIAVTDDKKMKKEFVNRMEKFGVKVMVMKDNPPDEIINSQFFTDIELLDMKPYINMVITNQELQFLYGFISEMSYHIQEAINELQIGIVDMIFKEEEKKIIEVMIEHMDMLCMDLIDGEMSTGYMTFDDYLDIESIVKDMYIGDLATTFN